MEYKTQQLKSQGQNWTKGVKHNTSRKTIKSEDWTAEEFEPLAKSQLLQGHKFNVRPGKFYLTLCWIGVDLKKGLLRISQTSCLNACNNQH